MSRAGVIASSRHVQAVSDGLYRAAVLADAPFCYFPLDDPTTPTDVMGMVTAASWLGLTLGATGIGDGTTAGQFDGGAVGRGVILPVAQVPVAGVTAFSIEVIAKATDMGTARSFFSCENVALLRHSNANMIEVFTGSGGWANQIGADTLEPEPTAIHHWAEVWDGVTATLYRDGVVFLSEPAVEIPPNGSNVYIGGRGQTDKTFLGALAGFAYYTTALTPERILAHAQAAAVV